MSLKILFAGTPDFACATLSALFNSPHTVLGVYAQPDKPAGRGRHLKMSPVKQLALEHHCPVFTPSSLKSTEEQARMQSLAPDVLVVAAYGLLLPPAVLAIPKYGCINVHASLLPRWRGASPIHHAILANDPITGITIMQMDAGLDTGDILSLHPYPIASEDTSETLTRDLAQLGATALLSTLTGLEAGELSPQKQDNEKATLAPKISKQAAKIDWSNTANDIHQKIRAFNPWPIAFTEIHQAPLRIFSARVLDPATSSSAVSTTTTASTGSSGLQAGIPGTIVHADQHGIDVATGKGLLRVLELQLPGGKRMPVASILNSKSDFFKIGTQFS